VRSTWEKPGHFHVRLLSGSFIEQLQCRVDGLPKQAEKAPKNAKNRIFQQLRRWNIRFLASFLVDF
jgi:hypothetical protein